MENVERITKKLERTITAAELIGALQELDSGTRVVFSSDYGDHCHTQQLHLIHGQINEVGVYESAYSGSGLAEADEDRKNFDELPKVFVIA